MAKPTVEQLQGQIERLQEQIDRLTGRRVARAEAEKQTDYVEHGSAEHAALLGIRKATDEDKTVVEGWALEDISNWMMLNEEQLTRVLRGKVNELTYPVPKTQSEDSRKPHFAPVMWQPGQPFSQITE